MPCHYPVRPHRYHTGHRLPFRLEIQKDELAVPFAVIVDADHLDVDYTGDTFDDMLDLVATANSVLPHSVAERLSNMSPCVGMGWRAAAAFECLANCVFTHWITPEVIAELRAELCWCELDGTPHPVHVRRWNEWRRIEDKKLVAAGLRAPAAPPPKASKPTAKSHLSLVHAV